MLIQGEGRYQIVSEYFNTRALATKNVSNWRVTERLKDLPPFYDSFLLLSIDIYSYNYRLCLKTWVLFIKKILYYLKKWIRSTIEIYSVITSTKLCQRHQQGFRWEGRKNKEKGAKGCHGLSKQGHLLMDKRPRLRKETEKNLLNAIIIKKRSKKEGIKIINGALTFLLLQ